MRDLLEYRAEFPILEHTTYLVSHSLGAMPRRAADRLAEYARMWAERGIRSWAEGWWATPWTVGDQVGRIVGAPPGSTVMHQNVAIAEAVALSCFRPVDPARNRVVYERGNFPSVRYLYQAQPDLEVVVCEDEGEILERIDERTLLVPISHVLFKAAEIQDVEPIVRRAHEVGAHVILDCYQSAGIVPLDVGALGVDFAVGGSVKWLCGGPGNAWLYVRPDLAERLQPTFTGWQAHARPFAFEEDLEYAPGAARFLTGTPNPAAPRNCPRSRSLARRKTLPASRNPTAPSPPMTARRTSAFNTTSPFPPVGNPVELIVASVPSRSREKPRTVVSPPAKNRSLAGSRSSTTSTPFRTTTGRRRTSAGPRVSRGSPPRRAPAPSTARSTAARTSRPTSPGCRESRGTVSPCSDPSTAREGTARRRSSPCRSDTWR